jgi:3-phenylpropionate/trans-cinnamate dioxygenase ferredoxin reductase subunit
VAGVVIVGASLAGVNCASALRAEGYRGPVTLIGDEEHMPYDRPPLSKGFLLGSIDQADVWLRSADLDAELRLGVRAVALDHGERRVRLDDGTGLVFDHLVIATGSAARALPGATLRNVLTLRTLDDASRLGGALRSARRAVIVGAGFIGLEVASACRELGLGVVVVEAAEAPLARVLPEMLGQRVADLARDGGVDLRCGVGVVGLEGDGTVERVRLGDGSVVPADVVLVAIGADPNVDWLEDSGLTLEDGIVCDGRCVAAEDVYAAGDVARWWHAGLGRHVRFEHWSNAVEQGRAVASAIVHGDEAEPYVPVPFVWSDQFGAKIQCSGTIAVDGEIRVVEDDRETRRFVATCNERGRVVGAFAINRPARVARLTSQLKAQWATPAVA